MSQACREFGISRTLFYRWRRRYLAYGPDGLYPKRAGPRRGRPPTLSVEAERAILSLSLQLARPEYGGWQVSPSTVYRALRLKGVGKVYQYTACDVASAYAIAQVSTEFSAAAAARFLTTRVLPAYQAAGWPVRRVLTDWGSEYRGAFDQACQAHGIRHTRTQPRHAWTNGPVERLQGTILHELWRVEFRRRFFTRLPQLQAALDRYLEFYNHRRLHLGYRTRGRTPADLFWGAVGRRYDDQGNHATSVYTLTIRDTLRVQAGARYTGRRGGVAPYVAAKGEWRLGPAWQLQLTASLLERSGYRMSDGRLTAGLSLSW